MKDHPTSSVPTPVQVQTAIRLGWTLAELYGWFHKGKQLRLPQPKATLPRLSFSDYPRDEARRLWLTSRRMAELADRMEELGVVVDPAPLYTLSDDVRRFVLSSGQREVLSAQMVYDRLEGWSLLTLNRLEAISGTLALAFTFGGNLADTFWGMRSPPPFQPQGKTEDSWHVLLNGRRMIPLIRHARRLQPYLPPEVGLALRHSLWEWNLAREFELVDDEETLHIAYPWLYRWRSLTPLRWLRERLTEKRRPPSMLVPAWEKALHDNLEKQASVWAELIYGTRLSTDYLKPSDWRWVFWLAAITSVLTMATILASLVTVGVLLIRLAANVYARFSPQIALPVDFGEQWTLVTTLVAVALGLGTQATRVPRGLVDLYRRVRAWLIQRKVEQRTLFAWDGRLKPFFFVIVEGLVFHLGGGEE